MFKPAALLILAALPAGCDKPAPITQAKPSNPSTQSAIVPMGNGIARGVITYTGPRPPIKQIAAASLCCPGAPAIFDPSITVNDQNELANVVVYIKDAPQVQFQKPGDVLIDQKDCVFIPRMTAMQTGQKLKVTSSDPVLHNFHTLAELIATSNFAISKGDIKTFEVNQTAFDPPVKVKCDVHPWMTTYIASFDHPFFAVTDAKGRFEITGLPPGQYTLVCWHEKLKRFEKSITISDAAPVDVSLVIK